MRVRDFAQLREKREYRTCTSVRDTGDVIGAGAARCCDKESHRPLRDRARGPSVTTARARRGNQEQTLQRSEAPERPQLDSPPALCSRATRARRGQNTALRRAKSAGTSEAAPICRPCARPGPAGGARRRPGRKWCVKPNDSTVHPSKSYLKNALMQRGGERCGKSSRRCVALAWPRRSLTLHIH